MKLKPILLIGLLLAGLAQANMIPLEAFRSVSASGSARDEVTRAESSYFQSVSQTGFGDFNASVAASAQQGRSWADSSSSQISEITAGEISLHSILQAREGLTDHTYPFPQDSGAASFAQSVFEITFRVAEPLFYELDAFRTLFYYSGYLRLDFLLGSASYGNLLSELPIQALYPEIFGGYSGLLLPDIYTLRFKAEGAAFADPLGDTEGADYGMNFRVSPVPDAGGTLMLLGIALCAIGAVANHFPKTA